MNFIKQAAPLSALGVILSGASLSKADPTGIPLAALSALSPYQKFIFDLSGNLYGVEGSSIFELSGPRLQTESTGVTFKGVGSQLVADSAGNFYLSAANGGVLGGGGVYMLSGTNHQTVTTLGSFSTMDSIGAITSVGYSLVINTSGNIYGSTNPSGGPDGTVYELSGPNHQFISGTVDPSVNVTDLGFDAAGNLLGVSGNGLYTEILKFNPNQLLGVQTIVTSFAYDGLSQGGSTLDKAGNVYGTLTGGVTDDGEVFELSGTNDQTFTVLATFNGSNGSTPLAGLTVDANGNIFGTTSQGGLYNDGTVFEISGANHQTFTTLLNYNSGNSNLGLIDGLTADQYGNLYTGAGTVSVGAGEVIELTNTGFAVPEPASLAMLGIPAAIALLRRRRGGFAGGRHV